MLLVVHLLSITPIEISFYPKEKKNFDSSKYYWGILSIKSEFYQNHGQLKDAHTTLQDALKITDSLGVVTLRKMITERIHDLNQLIDEAEVSTDTRERA